MVQHPLINCPQQHAAFQQAFMPFFFQGHNPSMFDLNELPMLYLTPGNISHYCPYWSPLRQICKSNPVYLPRSDLWLKRMKGYCFMPRWPCRAREKLMERWDRKQMEQVGKRDSWSGWTPKTHLVLQAYCNTFPHWAPSLHTWLGWLISLVYR